MPEGDIPSADVGECCLASFAWICQNLQFVCLLFVFAFEAENISSLRNPNARKGD